MIQLIKSIGAVIMAMVLGLMFIIFFPFVVIYRSLQ